VVTLALAAAVLAVYREVYWRPFDDEAQESLASFHAFGFAAASTVGWWPDPLAARDVDVEQGRVMMYPHWTNVFFLILDGAVRVFGASETVGRSVAISGVLLGFTLIAFSLEGDRWLVCLAVPLLLLSGPGRDGVPFVFADVALYVGIGLVHWVREARAFRGALVAAMLLNHLVLPYAIVAILLQRIEGGSKRRLLGDLGTLAGATAVVGAALLHAGGGWSAGWQGMESIFRLRSEWSVANLSVALRRDVIRTLNLEPFSNYLMAAAWAGCLAARRWRTAALLPSFLLFSLVLREYVATHEFTRLPLVFFCLVTVSAALEEMLERIPRKPVAQAARVLVVALLAVRVGAGTQRYGRDPRIQAAREQWFQTLRGPGNAAVLERCNAFTFSGDRLRWLPDERMAQFFLGRRVAEGTRRGESRYACEIDLDQATIVQRAPPAASGHSAP